MNAKSHNPVRRGGFTLMELLVVIGVIALVSGLAIPAISNFFTAGADAQAYNLLVATCVAARAEAVRTHSFTAVHIQADRTPSANESLPPQGKVYLGVFRYDSGSGVFVANTDFVPKALPGGMGFGEGSNYFLDPASNALQNLTDANMRDFTSFTIVFAPNGSIARNVPFQTGNASGKIRFNPADGYFTINAPSVPLWFPNTANATNRGAAGGGEDGVRCVWMFELKPFIAIGNNAAARATWLQKNGQQIAINFHTGQLLPRE